MPEHRPDKNEKKGKGKKETPRYFWSRALSLCAQGKTDKSFLKSCTEFRQPLLANAGYRARIRRTNAMQCNKNAHSLLPLLLPPYVLSLIARASRVQAPIVLETGTFSAGMTRHHHHRARLRARPHSPAVQAAASAP